MSRVLHLRMFTFEDNISDRLDNSDYFSLVYYMQLSDITIFGSKIHLLLQECLDAQSIN